MDDELKRKIAASLDARPDAAADPAVVRALESDAQARAFAKGLRVIETALNHWPVPSRSAAEWELAAAALEKRLGDVPAERKGTPPEWDPLERPLLEDDGSDARRNESEHTVMSESHDDKNDDDDLAGLAALTRTSTVPTTNSVVPAPPVLKTGPSLHDDAMDESSGIVDIKNLAEIALRQSAPPPSSALKPTPADTTGRADAAVMAGELPTAKASAAVPAATAGEESARAKAKETAASAAKKPAVAAPAAQPRSSSRVWLGPLIAAAAVAAFFVWKNGQAPSMTGSDQAVAAHEEQSAATAPGSGPTAATAPASPMIVAATPPPPPPAAEAAPTLQPPVAGGTLAAPVNPVPTVVAGPEAAGGAPAPAAREQPVPAAAAAPAEPSRAANAHAAAPSAPPPERRARTASTGSTAAEPAHEAPAPARAEPTPAPAQRPAAETHAAAAPAPQPAPAAAPATTAQPARGSGHAAAASSGGGNSPRSMDELMQAAVGPHGSSQSGGGGAAPASNNAAPAAANSGALPDRPTRSQVTATMSPLTPAVRACTQGATGNVTVGMVIRNDGTVQSASASGPFNADALSCIQRTVQRAHFPPFTRPTVPIVFPFSIQPPHAGGG